MRSERHQSIVLLERTIDRDGLDPFSHSPQTSTGAAIAHNTRAAAHEGNEETILCRDCNGAGERRIRTVIQLCPTCKGRGVEVVDQYTGRRLKTEVQEGDLQARMVRCDRCGGTGEGRVATDNRGIDRRLRCEVCWGAKVVPGPRYPIRPFRGNGSKPQREQMIDDPVLRCMELRQSEGSYDELALALAALRLEQRALYWINIRVFIFAYVEEDQLRGQRILLEESLCYLSELMPAEIRVPEWAERYEERRREKVLAERNREEAAA